MKRVLVATILVALSLLCGGCGTGSGSSNYQCGAQAGMALSISVQSPVTNMFPIKALGASQAHWTFQNTATGDYTWFDFSPYQTWGYSNTPGTVMHITKSTNEAYWLPGTDAEVWQAESDDGTAIWSPAQIQRRNSNFVSYNQYSHDQYEPYYYLPDVYTAPFYFESEHYDVGENGSTYGKLTHPTTSDSLVWRIGFYAENVTTPVVYWSGNRQPSMRGYL